MGVVTLWSTRSSVNLPLLRIGFYYGGPREPNDQTNPYGNLLADARGRAGVDVSCETALDEVFG